MLYMKDALLLLSINLELTNPGYLFFFLLNLQSGGVYAYTVWLHAHLKVLEKAYLVYINLSSRFITGDKAALEHHVMSLSLLWSTKILSHDI
ncbi:hypothetical protein PNOK_0980800 [Pyrrhoderma noxium]|uniref:Uncharacterized protein n=1 Tax=Pyrrhoderma noxium TaxID=2282107 RepID=A0A286U565_9AGAM|nr:hypothetical protein PNOK_0980800 [Pyrrhoderma noxium]